MEGASHGINEVIERVAASRRTDADDDDEFDLLFHSSISTQYDQ
jgi:hypothetical protein